MDVEQQTVYLSKIGDFKVKGGLVMDRDQTTALNILKLGLQSLGLQSLEVPWL